MTNSNVLPIEKNLAFLTYGLYQDSTYMQAVARLTAHKFKDPRTTFHVMKLTKKISEELKTAQECFIKTLMNYAELDENEEIKPMEDKPDTYKIKEDKVEEWKEAFPKYKEIKVSLNRKKVNLADLEGFDMSAMEMDALAGIIDVDIGEEVVDTEV